MLSSLLALASLSLLHPAHAGGCGHLNSCNGHGNCDTATSRCLCYNGWGSASDVALYKAPDCSARTCPSDLAWVDVPTGADTAHALAECSNAGLCDRSSGLCRCFVGYDGEACQRCAFLSAHTKGEVPPAACPPPPPPPPTHSPPPPPPPLPRAAATCPNSCSSQGKCVSIKAMAREQNAEPFGPASTYGGRPESSTWDEDKVYGCVCDSSWPVGFGAGETQAPEYTAADCSQRRCPSGDDPRTVTVDETDCAYFAGNGAAWMGVVGTDGKNYAPGAALPPGVGEAVAASGTPGVDQGAVGNKCFVECANRGTCNRATGVCSCFPGCAFPRRAPCPPPLSICAPARSLSPTTHTRARAHTHRPADAGSNCAVRQAYTASDTRAGK